MKTYKVKTDLGIGEIISSTDNLVGETATVYVEGTPYNTTIREIIEVVKKWDDEESPDFPFL